MNKKDGQEIGEIDWPSHKQKGAGEREIYCSPNEMARIISHLSNNIKLAVLWSLYSMARLGETESLNRKDVYFDERFCWVDGKSGKRRILLNDICLAALKKAFDECDDRIRVFDLTNRRRQWERARKLANRPDLRWHDLRHIGATWLRQFGTSDLKKVQKVLGHSRLSTTGRYSHVGDDETFEALNEMPNVLEIDLSSNENKK